MTRYVPNRRNILSLLAGVACPQFALANAMLIWRRHRYWNCTANDFNDYTRAIRLKQFKEIAGLSLS